MLGEVVTWYASRFSGGMILNNAKLSAFADNVDRLISVDLHCRPELLTLQEAARERQGGNALCMSAARILGNAIDPDRRDVVIFITGFMSETLIRGEQDGPVGTACLARGLSEGLRVRPVIVTDTPQVEMVQQTCKGAGFNVFDQLEVGLERGVARGKSLSVIDFAYDHEQARIRARDLVEMVHPVAAIAVERPSMSETGTYHSISGRDISDLTAKTDYIFLECQRRGIPTIGIADGGNELGCGLIRDVIIERRPNQARCICSCGGTMASNTPSDFLVFGAVSDWGAFGIEACMAALLGKNSLLHSEDTMVSTLQQAVGAGLHDGMRGWLEPGSDGVPWRIEKNIIGMLRSMLDLASVDLHEEQGRIRSQRV